MAAEGLILEIQRGTLHDGPGMRTTVFLKGCSLRCAWCHNPASIKREPEQRKRMQNNQLIEETAGYSMDSDSLISLVKRDLKWFSSTGGGLTLSGGEPLLQSQFVCEVLEKARSSGIHCCIETSGAVSRESLEQCLPYVDLWLYDWKHSNETELRQWTRANLDTIRNNLNFILDRGGQVVLRLPLIPGVNDTEEHWTTIGDIGKHPNILAVEILPYHAWGRLLWEEVGRPLPPDFRVPEKDQINQWILILENLLPQGKLKNRI
ncbi:MAG: radical SAM protein [Spirochaetales bacterium]|nr:radical SAM protein [Spirochaetales bacterium]